VGKHVKIFVSYVPECQFLGGWCFNTVLFLWRRHAPPTRARTHARARTHTHTQTILKLQIRMSWHFGTEITNQIQCVYLPHTLSLNV